MSDGLQARCPYCNWAQNGEDWNLLAEQFRSHLEIDHGVPVIAPQP